MDYLLTDEQKQIKALIKRIAQEKLLPVRAALDRSHEFPWEPLRVLAQAGLFGVYIPEEYGGLGKGCFELCLAVEELSRVCGAIGVSYAASALGCYPLLLFGSEEQKRRFVPSIASGEKLAAFSLTEASAGSDASAIKTTARRVDGGYILNGTKQWVTNGGEAETYTVIAMTDKKKGARGASAFVVEKSSEGLSFGKKEEKMGICASATTELIFEDCFVSAENLLAREGMGFIVALKTLDNCRPGVGAQAVGIAQGALDEALHYARTRLQFDKPIASFQAIQHMLADMATQVEASRALVYSVARYIDSGARDYSKVSSMAKVFASDVAMKVTTDAVQIFGGYGYMKDYPVEKMMRDAKITQIYEGTNQIQRNVIALALIKEAASGKH